MIRDRLIVGIRDNALSERLQLDADLNLEKAKKAIQQWEAVREQQKTLQGSQEPSASSIRVLRPGKDSQRFVRQRSGQSQSGKNRRGKTSLNGKKTCTRCGQDPHSRDKCPAKDASCHRCKKKGHYGAMCRSKLLIPWRQISHLLMSHS